MTVKEKINSLIAAANQTTSKTDVDLTAAVKSLVDGYGGGSSEIHSESYTMTSEITFTDFLNSCNFQLLYKKSVVLFLFTGTSIATQGSYTYKLCMGYHVNTTHTYIFYDRQNGLVSPNGMTLYAGGGSANNGYWDISSSGVISKGVSSLAVYTGVGNTITIYELPVEDTLWGV